jgi:hypothetical protein
MLFIGMDLSLSNCGLVVLDYNGKVQLLKSIKTEEIGQSVEKRFERCYNQINQFKETLLKYDLNDSIIAIESYALQAVGRITSLVESGTLIRDFIYKNYDNCKILEVAPVSAKKFLLGSGKSDSGINKKAKIIMEIYKQFGLEIGDDNIADAFVLSNIAQAYYNVINNNHNLKKYQLEVITTIMKKDIPKKTRKTNGKKERER